MGKKRGQITIFIIVGIILLFSTALILYIRSRVTEEIPAAEVPAAIAEVPAELQPINNYVRDCVEQTATDATIALGAHGGYLGTTPEDAERYRIPAFLFASQGLNPTDDDGITLSPEWQVPYWFFMKSRNACQGNCQFSKPIPPLTGTSPASIESQVSSYVGKNLRACLGNFAAFTKLGYAIREVGEMAVTAQVRARDVLVYVDYPIEVTKDGAKSQLSQFRAILDVNLRKAYDLAVTIAEKQASDRFLEQHVLDLIAAYSGIDEGTLPPMAGTDMDPSAIVSKMWLKSDVARKLQELLAAYTNAVQVTNTRNFRVKYFAGDPIRTALYNKKVVPIDRDFTPLRAEFNYLGWPLYLYITKGELITAKESVMQSIFSVFLMMQRYDFPYDVSYPVLVQVEDRQAFNGKGFDLFFALEANVRNNEPFTSDSPVLQSGVSIDADDGQLCDPNQRVSGNVTFKVVDRDGKPVDGATVRFVSSTHQCGIGQSTLNERGEAVFKGAFPTGAIGALLVEKPDYGSYVLDYFMPPEEDKDLGKIVLDQHVKKKVGAAKINVNKVFTPDGYQWKLVTPAVPLAEKEEAIVILQRIKENPFELDVVASARIRGNGLKEMDLIPGKYTMSVMLMAHDTDIVIPFDHQCKGGVLGTGLGEECFDLPEVSLSSKPTIPQQSLDLIPPEQRAGVEQASQPLPEGEDAYTTGRRELEGSFFAGQYETVIEIGDDLYLPAKKAFPLELIAINWNIESVPSIPYIAGVPRPAFRREHKDLEAFSKLGDYVEQNKQRFGYRYGRPR